MLYFLCHYPIPGVFISPTVTPLPPAICGAPPRHHLTDPPFRRMWLPVLTCAPLLLSLTTDISHMYKCVDARTGRDKADQTELLEKCPKRPLTILRMPVAGPCSYTWPSTCSRFRFGPCFNTCTPVMTGPR